MAPGDLVPVTQFSGYGIPLSGLAKFELRDHVLEEVRFPAEDVCDPGIGEIHEELR